MPDITIKCDCGVYIHCNDLNAGQVIELALTWVRHEHSTEEIQ